MLQWVIRNDASHTVTTTCPHGCNNGKCLDAPVNSLKILVFLFPLCGRQYSHRYVYHSTTDRWFPGRWLSWICIDSARWYRRRLSHPQTLVGWFIRLPGSNYFSIDRHKNSHYQRYRNRNTDTKTINIVEEETDTENTWKSPINMALLDNTKGLLNGQVNTFFRLDVVAWSQDININTIPLFGYLP